MSDDVIAAMFVAAVAGSLGLLTWWLMGRGSRRLARRAAASLALKKRLGR